MEQHLQAAVVRAQAEALHRFLRFLLRQEAAEVLRAQDYQEAAQAMVTQGILAAVVEHRVLIQ